LVEVDPQWQESRIEREVEGVKDRTTMYIILAIVVATVGMLEGGLLLISASLLGLFGIVLVCLGIGYPATAHRYERKAVSLQKQLNR
jgi:sulfite exporter TauE/SafE